MEIKRGGHSCVHDSGIRQKSAVVPHFERKMSRSPLIVLKARQIILDASEVIKISTTLYGVVSVYSRLGMLG
jgi:hypothetical protein